MKRLIKVNVTEKLLDVDSYDSKEFIGQEHSMDVYRWSDNEEDAIGEAMAYCLNLALENSTSLTLLETKETSIKIKREDCKTTWVMNLSFTT